MDDDPLLPSDLPSDWRRLYGAALEKELASIYADEDHSRLRSVPDWRTKIILATATLSNGPNIFQAKYLCDSAAFCYEVQAMGAATFTPDESFPISSYTWTVEAIDRWSALCSQDAKADGRKGLAVVEITDAISRGLQCWMGDDAGGCAAQGWALDELLDRHRRLCDLIDAFAQDIIASGKELVPKYPKPCVFARPAEWPVTFMPTCRAVVIIAPKFMTARWQVLVVLTGDNEKLKSGAPSLDDIPAEEIISVRANNIVEVTLQTAIWFVACVEAAEYAADETLRAIHAERRTRIVSNWHQRAVDALDNLEKLAETAPEEPIGDRNLVDALDDVIGDELLAPLDHAT